LDKKCVETEKKILAGPSKSSTSSSTKKENVSKNDDIGSDGPPPPMDIGSDGPPPMDIGGSDGPPPPFMGDGPPPPPGMGDGPPPPPGMGGDGPPPPMMMGKMGGGGGGPKLPPLPNKKASIPMKSIFWTKLPPKEIPNSIWMKKDILKTLEKVELEEKILEELFSAKQKVTILDEKKNEEVKEEIVNLVDGKKSSNGSIILGSLRMKYEDIAKAILKMDDGVLKNDTIISLCDLAPSAEEMQACLDYKKEKKELKLLGQVEKYYLAISDIKRYQERMKVWIIRNQFESNAELLKPQFIVVLNSIYALMESKGFMKLLQIVLATGNFLNSQKTGAQIHGFSMNSLLKLRDHKSTTTKFNLLSYIYDFLIFENDEDTLKFFDDLVDIPACSKIQLQNLRTELNDMKTNLAFVEKEIDENSKFNDSSDSFGEVMKSFLGEANDTYETFEDNWKEIETKQEQLRKLYGEDEKKFKLEEFVTTINQFLDNWREVVSEHERKKEIEEKKLAREKKRQEALEKREKKEKKEKVIIEEKIIENEENEENNEFQEEVVVEKKKIEELTILESGGVLDDLQNDLMNGSAFKKKPKKKKPRKSVRFNDEGF
jgi:hypothetical protein